MRLSALKHVARVARELLGGEGRLIVVGSSSLLGSFPELGEQGQALETSFDADLILEPFDEEKGVMLHEALGEDRRFHVIHGYHADIIRPEMEHQFPRGWRDRLVSLQGCENVFCLEPHDLAAAKCQVGREKDVALLVALVRAEHLDWKLVRERLGRVEMENRVLVRADLKWKEVAAAVKN